MTKIICPIWGTPAEKYPVQGDNLHFDSPRAGGQFKISGSALAEARFLNLDFAAKARLTTWIVNQHRSGTPVPVITTEVVSAALTAKPMKVTQKIENFFNILHEKNIQIEDEIIDTHYSEPFKIDGVDYSCEIKDSTELSAFAKLLISMNIFNNYGHLSLEGFKLLEKYITKNIDSKQVFVAMWFGGESKQDNMDNVYNLGIKPGIENDTGYTAIRIDHIEHNEKIDDRIVLEIRRSKFVVADFTCDDYEIEGKKRPDVRGGVYYEAGFAHGLDKTVIFTCREDCQQHVHFDTSHFNHIFWKDEADLMTKLNNRIRGSLGLSKP